MNKQNNGGRLALIILGSAAIVAGISAALYYNEDTRHRIEGVVNRERAKMFVRNKLNGSDELVRAVDNLSDQEVNTIVKMASGAGNLRDKTSDAFTNIVDRAKEVASDVSHSVQEYFE